MFCTVLLVPAAAGRPDAELTSPLMLIGMNPNRVSTQPFAPGALNELSTNVPFLASRISRTGSKPTSTGLPLIGLFGGGGLVVPVIMLRLIGLDGEPT